MRCAPRDHAWKRGAPAQPRCVRRGVPASQALHVGDPTPSPLPQVAGALELHDPRIHVDFNNKDGVGEFEW